MMDLIHYITLHTINLPKNSGAVGTAPEPLSVYFFYLWFHLCDLALRVAAGLAGRMNGAGVCTDARIARRDTLSPVRDHPIEDEADHRDQKEQDKDGPAVGSKPGHGKHLLFVLGDFDFFRQRR